MNFIILASVLILGLVIFLFGNNAQKKNAESIAEFWKRERAANNTRRQPLDDLNYLSIPLSSFPMTLMTDQEEIAECAKLVQSLSHEKIVNFTGVTNTDLKLRYGAPNITLLSQYDQNYTLLVRTLQKWASLLYEAGCPEQACPILEYAISSGSDISGSYRLLCKIYQETGQSEKIKSLSVFADSLQSVSKGAISRILAEYTKSDD